MALTGCGVLLWLRNVDKSIDILGEIAYTEEVAKKRKRHRPYGFPIYSQQTKPIERNMSNLTLHSDYASGLTEFNRDGLELFIHKDGSVHSDLNAIARMCDVSQGAIYRKVVTSADSKIPYITHKKVTPGGTQPIHLYPVSVVMACAQKYNPKLSEKFMEMGANVYLYQLAGYSVKPTVIAPVAPSLTELQLAVEMQKLLTDKIELLVYIADKPGLAHKIAQAHNGFAALTTELLSFDEMCDLRGITRYPMSIKRELSRKLANAVANDNLVLVGTKTVTKAREGDKKPQYYTVNAYSVESLPHFDNVIKLYLQTI